MAAKLRQYGAKNVVVDPVMVSTSGTSLLSEAGRRALWEELLPLSTLVTPNLPEAQVFSGQPVETEGTCSGPPGKSPVVAVARSSSRGGHLAGDAADLLYEEGKRCGSGPGEFQSQHPRHRLHPLLRHCLRSGSRLQFGGESVRRAKDYLSGALSAGLDLGHGPGLWIICIGYCRRMTNLVLYWDML